MIGGVTRLGGLPGLPGRVTLSAGVAFCHVNDSRWGNPPSRGRVHVTSAEAPNSNHNKMAALKMTVKSHSTEMLQREQIMRGKEHWPAKCVVRPPFSLFTCLATTQQRLVTSPRDPGVVSLHVNAGHFHSSTTARRVTSPTWGPPPPCKQALLTPYAWLRQTFKIHHQASFALNFFHILCTCILFTRGYSLQLCCFGT